MRSAPAVAWVAKAAPGFDFITSPVHDSTRGRVFMVGSDGYLYAFSAANGTLTWRSCVGTKGPFPSSPCGGYKFPSASDEQIQPVLDVGTGNVFWVVAMAGDADWRSTLFCVNGTDGTVVWKQTPGLYNPDNGDSATILLLLVHPSGDVIFWQRTNGDYHLVRVNGRKGAVVFNVTDPDWEVARGYLTYVDVDDSLWTSAASDPHAIVKFSASTGKVLFVSNFDMQLSNGLNVPVLYDSRTQLVHIAALQSAYALNAVTGDPVFSIGPPVDGGWINSGSTCPGGVNLWYTDHTELYAWSAAAAAQQKPLWDVDCEPPIDPTYQITSSVDGIVVVDQGSSIKAFDCSDGSQLWEYQAPTTGSSQYVYGCALGARELYANSESTLVKLVAQA